jgi:hypothetical protein
MTEPDELAARKAALAAVEAEIAGRTQEFEDSIADLRQQHLTLRREYADALRSELAKVDVSTAPKAHLGRILAAIERTQQPIIVGRMRELAARRVPGNFVRRQ